MRHRPVRAQAKFKECSKSTGYVCGTYLVMQCVDVFCDDQWSVVQLQLRQIERRRRQMEADLL